VVTKKLKLFQDVNPRNGSAGGVYPATNESLETHKELLGNKKFDRIAGICSGGEVGLFVLLPRVKRQLTLIDYNYPAIGFTLLKIMLIQEVGGKRAHEFVTSRYPYNKECPEFLELKKLIKKFQSKLPGKVLDSMVSTRYSFLSPSGVNFSIASAWKHVTAKQVEEIENKLDLVEIVHGDLSNLGGRDKYDALYLSNALDYAPKPQIFAEELFTSCLKEGGLILSTHSDYIAAKTRVPESLVQEVNEISGHGTLGWKHVLHKYKPAVVAVA